MEDSAATLRNVPSIDPAVAAWMRRLSSALSVAVALLGVLVLGGWAFGIEWLKSAGPSLETMKPNTAALFVLLGAGLWLARAEGATRLRSAIAVAVMVVAALTLAQYVFGLDFAIDQLLLPRAANSTSGPARMSPVTALNFLLLGFALLRLERGERGASDGAAMVAAALSFLALCGYFYGARELYQLGPHVAVALHTTLGFLAAALAFFCARPAEGASALLASDTTAGKLLRRTLPLVACVPLSLAWLLPRGQEVGVHAGALSIALLNAAATSILAASLFFITSSLHVSELERRRAEQALGRSAERLRHLVEGSPFAVAMLDRELRYVYASERWIADYHIELSHEQLRGRSHYDLFPAMPEHWKQLHQRCLAGETLRHDGEAFVRGDGAVDWIRWEMRPWHDRERVAGILIFSEDVSARKHAEEELKRAKEQFRLALEAAPTGMLMIDEAGAITLANAQIERLFGYTREQLLGNPVEMLVPERFRAAHRGQRGQYVLAPQGRSMGVNRELYGLRRDGSELPVEIRLNPLQTPGGSFTLCSVADMSERRQAERQREELLLQREVAKRHQERSRFFELSLDLVCIASTSGRFLQLSPGFSSTLGYATEELLGAALFDFIHPEDVAATRSEVERLAAGNVTLDFTNRCRCKDGGYRWLQWRCIPDSDGTLYAIARDVTSHREQVADLQSRQVSLSASLKERDVLLQEIHHRVKNNLQIISSLINMQLRTVGEPERRGALEECQSRVQAIALIHEKLYQSRDYGRVPFSEYARSLASDIFHTLGASRARVELQVEVDSVFLPVGRAIPCGLIVNELLTNALKHAFPGDRSGVVRVELHQANSHELLLVVSDDGVGMPASVDVANTTSIGLQLVSTLVEQLEGQLDIRRDGGTMFRIQFPAAGAADGDEPASQAQKRT